MNIFLILITFFIPVLGLILFSIMWLKTPSPNRIFGFKTKITLSNNQAWYDVNKVSGIVMSILSLILLIFNILWIIYSPYKRIELTTIISVGVETAIFLLAFLILYIWHIAKWR